jgi:hypothetical protein
MLIYTDTSTIGGCFDKEFEAWSNRLYESFKKGSNQLMLSDLTLQELELAEEKVRDKVMEVPETNIQSIGISDEAIQLAETYILEGA